MPQCFYLKIFEVSCVDVTLGDNHFIFNVQADDSENIFFVSVFEGRFKFSLLAQVNYALYVKFFLGFWKKSSISISNYFCVLFSCIKYPLSFSPESLNPYGDLDLTDPSILYDSSPKITALLSKETKVSSPVFKSFSSKMICVIGFLNSIFWRVFVKSIKKWPSFSCLSRLTLRLPVNLSASGDNENSSTALALNPKPCKHIN